MTDEPVCQDCKQAPARGYYLATFGNSGWELLCWECSINFPTLAFKPLVKTNQEQQHDNQQ